MAVETRRPILIGCLVGTMVLPAAGCRQRPAAAAIPTTQPLPYSAVSPSQTFSSESARIRLAYPAGWETRHSDDYLFLAAPAGNADGSSISLDVPSLPFHLPGMIGIGLVQNGYLDDLKKSHTELNVDSAVTRSVGGVAGRYIESTWNQADRRQAELALLLVHADRVYILRVNGPAADLPKLRPIFDAAVASIEWLK